MVGVTSVAGPLVRDIPGEGSPRHSGSSCSVAVTGTERPKVSTVGKKGPHLGYVGPCPSAPGDVPSTASSKHLEEILFGVSLAEAAVRGPQGPLGNNQYCPSKQSPEEPAELC